MQIRPRKTKIVPSDYLLPIFRNLTEEGIQDVIKSRISQKEFSEFLDKKINEDTIEDYRKLLELKGNLYSVFTDKEKKYLFDLIMVLIYEEVLTYTQIITIIQSNGVSAIDIFEKMVILEYELFVLTKNITEATKTFFKTYVTDKVVNVYHSTKDFSAYKDLNNLEEELLRIYNDTLNTSPFNGTLPTVLSSIGDFNSKALVRINGELATVEKENQSKYFFILNYNTTASQFDRSYIRKYWALRDRNAYYIKNGVRIYLDGLTSYSYYGLFSSTFSPGYKLAHDFLTKLWENITQRTINY